MQFDKDTLQSISALCRQFGVKRLELFGSAARGDFSAGKSDYDFFVEFDSQDWQGAFRRYMGLKLALESLLAANVDLVQPEAITNQVFLKVANKHRKLVYAA